MQIKNFHPKSIKAYKEEFPKGFKELVKKQYEKGEITLEKHIPL